eukprot:TRINITY_DN658_c0_g1_i1.p1 TRINITY_DN658_c0_g1~~TRINITY_DN658_c0_g1_i1.p1  ORF type:complete len:319 (+),score=71.30 TRINITY_DN658_c0_g1_i1:185-1141(+)
MTARSVPLICVGHSRAIPDISYSGINKDGFFLVSACLDGKPMLRNGQTGDWIGTFEGHKGAVWSARINPEATIAVTGSADYTVKVWDAITGLEMKTFTHKRIVKSVDICPSSRQVAAGGQDKVIKIWDVESGTCLHTLEGHQDTVRQVLYMRNSDHLVLSGGADQVVRMWDTRSGVQVSTAFAKASVASLELSRDSKLLTSASGKEVTFWDATTLVPIKVHSVNYELNSASVNPDMTKFVAGGADFYVHVYDYKTGEELEVHKGHHGPVHCVRFAPDGETYASGADDSTIRLWQTSPKNYGLWQTNSSGSTGPSPAKK